MRRYCLDKSSEMSSGLASAGIAYCSLAHSPRSISLQRLLQKGRKALSGENSASCLQVGHATNRFLGVFIMLSVKVNQPQ